MTVRTKPTEQQLRLVTALAAALADFFGERRGNFGCHVQAAVILTTAGPLKGYQTGDFKLRAEDFFEEIT